AHRAGTEHPTERVGQHPGHGTALRLRRPAVEVRAVVREVQPYPDLGRRRAGHALPALAESSPPAGSSPDSSLDAESSASAVEALARASPAPSGVSSAPPASASTASCRAA